MAQRLPIRRADTHARDRFERSRARRPDPKSLWSAVKLTAALIFAIGISMVSVAASAAQIFDNSNAGAVLDCPAPVDQLSSDSYPHKLKKGHGHGV